MIDPKWPALTLAVAFLYACSSSPETPSKPERTNADAPIPTRKMARDHGVSFEDIGLGHAVYMRKCGECHPHKFPDEVKSSEWHIHVPGMAWNAGIEPHEEKALLQYLQTTAKDAENR